ncbi:DnaD domain protein [Lactobacillus sp. W8092]|nr:DnaD domain protein [Lactobacillus sp. W8092]
MTTPKIDPLWGYFVTSEQPLSNLDHVTLIDLYQPLVGSAALSLYQLLWQHQQPLLSQRSAHAQLFNLLDMDAVTFYEARIKLEAVALLSTYRAQDQLGQYLIYQLHVPLTPREFLHDNILKTFLYEKIGAADFQQLSKKYLTTFKLPDHRQEITKSFLEVFTLSSHGLMQMSTDSPNEPSAQPTVPPHYTPEQLATFDWQLLEQLLEKYHITPTEIARYQSELFNLHAFYGVSEIELADLIINTLDVRTNKMDLPRLQNLTQKRFEKRVNLTAQKTARLQATAPTASSQTADWKPAQRQLLQQAQRLAPADFLAAKKQTQKGFVGSAETRVLRQLQERAVLPNEVINILVDYVLNNSATLTQGLVEKIANDWLQHNITTAADALQYLTNYSNRLTTTPTTPRAKTAFKHSRSQSVRQEPVTDWKQHPAQKVDPKKLAQAKAQWKKYKNQSS